MTKLYSPRRRPLLGLVALLGLVLAGCASTAGLPGASPGGTVHSSQATALDDNLNGFLSQSPAGAVVALAESPWGKDVEIIADERYFAASGRECRRLRIVSTGTDSARRVVACQGEQGWQAQRLVTDSLTNSTTGSAR